MRCACVLNSLSAKQSIAMFRAVHSPIRGQIQLIFGPMFSGKTTELVRRLNRYRMAGQCCLFVTYGKDRQGIFQSVSTHDKQSHSAIRATTLADLRTLAIYYSVIAIDEGQFFPDVETFAEDMADRGKIVIVAALDGTFQRKAFGNMLQLVPLAESVVKLTAICMLCFGEASFTQRVGPPDIRVGEYKSVCRTCYQQQTCDGDLAMTSNNCFTTNV
ncbi:hypothetical protein JTE90_017586 [Oedothorax gibbosus]|uniref:Thymidine kinase n=1 Tax=Oedothorax gibbosus TaxID=931172 RepID=A0AAV6TMC4_9ARAC|nr:hypothetical protein JTE90_017586 [Oedothorax gibbosus]